jgi:hypothetical protein
MDLGRMNAVMARQLCSRPLSLDGFKCNTDPSVEEGIA